MSPPRHVPGGCRALLAELFDYLDGELSTSRCEALEAHLDQCPCCGDLAENLRKAMAICRSEGRRELPAVVRQRARQRIHALLGGLEASKRTRPPANKRGKKGTPQKASGPGPKPRRA